MQTDLSPDIRDTPHGREADAILRKCVHCGFCTATCPTYQLLGDELDGPRGRIYLMKQMLEGAPVGEATRTHLDRCLTCRACETTCPSGVEYGRLLDIGREMVEEKVPRNRSDRWLRLVLRTLVPYRRRFAAVLGLGQFVRPLLPGSLREKVPPRRRAGPWPRRGHARRMLVLEGCVQPSIAPDINAAAARLLDRFGIRLDAVPGAGCCGALPQHLAAPEQAAAFARANVDAWWPAVEAGVEAIVMTASGCGVQVRDYARILADDPHYAERALRIVSLTRDLSEVVHAEGDTGEVAGMIEIDGRPLRRVAFQAPCTLQHGQRITGVIEGLLERAGYTLTEVPEPHLCCGSAGTYSILQPQISAELRRRKLDRLEVGHPEAIATANIGCLAHLGAGTRIPVYHWAQLLAP
jgi:glycolate oxidase iron-sulfur subunit